MSAILAISREHGQAPSWFDALPGEDRTFLLADWRVRHPAPKQAKKRRSP